MFCYIVNDSKPSEYTKLEESFVGFINKSVIRFEYERSPLHTIVYGGTGTGKTYFVSQYLKLFQDDAGEAWWETHQDQDRDQDPNQNQNQDSKIIITVCKEERDCINPETGMPYSDFNMCDINMTTSKNMHFFRDSVIILDDMGDKLNKNKAYFFTEGRHHNIQMILMCLKPAQTINTARMSSDTVYLTTHNGADLFKNFNEINKCEHKFYEVRNDSNSSYYNCTDGMSYELRYDMIKYNKEEKTFIIIDRNRTMIYDSRFGFRNLKALNLKDKLENDEVNKLIDYLKPLMINATDRNTIRTYNYQFYFNKLLTSRGIKIHN